MRIIVANDDGFYFLSMSIFHLPHKVFYGRTNPYGPITAKSLKEKIQEGEGITGLRQSRLQTRKKAATVGQWSTCLSP